MKSFGHYIAEAFPPAKGKGPAAGAAGKKPNPFDKGGADKKPGAAGAPGEEGGGMPPGMGGAAGMGDGGAEIFKMQQDAEAEQQRQEAEAQAARDKVEQAEREQIKQMRATADQEVLDDLDTKFNQQPDQVEFYPSLDITNSDKFSDHLDKKMDGKDAKGKDDGDDSDGDAGRNGVDDDESTNTEAGNKKGDALDSHDANGANKEVGDDPDDKSKEGDDLDAHDKNKKGNVVSRPEQPGSAGPESDSQIGNAHPDGGVKSDKEPKEKETKVVVTKAKKTVKGK
jgi:hypothetical protein